MAISEKSNTTAPAVQGENTESGAGVYGISQEGAGLHGETNSTHIAAVMGITLNPESLAAAIYGEQKGKGPGMMGTSQEGTGVVGISQGGVGIHGETHSTTLAAVMGITLNPESLAAAVYGEQKGKGPGMMGISQEGAGVYGESKSPVVSAVAGTQVNPDSIGAGVYGEHKGKGAGVAGISQEGAGVYGESKSSTVAALVGIQANPYSTGAAIYGEHKGNGQAGYFKGDLLVTGDIKLINADCAEDFNIGTKVFVEPGTVMVLGEEGALFPSDKAYDKRVAGVISGAGDFKPGIVLDKQSSKNNRQPVALLGKVYCKVDAQYGAVEIGDLLTTAPTIGHAMKADDVFKSFGAVIGKALRPLKEGQGLIPILIALQ